MAMKSVNSSKKFMMDYKMPNREKGMPEKGKQPKMGKSAIGKATGPGNRGKATAVPAAKKRVK